MKVVVEKSAVVFGGVDITDDLYKILERDKKTEFFKIKLKPFVFGSMKYFNNKTNINFMPWENYMDGMMKIKDPNW